MSRWKIPILAAFVIMTAAPAEAAFHLWQIRELYTNSNGSVQFIELFNTNNNEQFVGGQQITMTLTGGGSSNTFTIPTNSSSPTANHALLFGSAGYEQLRLTTQPSLPQVDYTIPNNFLFQAGGSISFFGQNSGTYTALPTDGLLSRTWDTGENQINTPQNFAGTTSTIVPEPALLLAAGGIIGLACLRRRRSP